MKVCKQWSLFCEGLYESQGRLASGERDSFDNKDCGILWGSWLLMKPRDKSSVYFSVAVFFFFRIFQ